MSQAFGGPKGSGAKAPEKGVFPLDHFAECKKIADAYLECINLHDGNATPCLELSKQYLKCRMDRNLMAKQDLAELGLVEENSKPQAQAAQQQAHKG